LISNSPPGVKITVAKGMRANDGFSYSGPGRKSKKDFRTEEEAMLLAEKMAKAVLSTALETLRDRGE
jgi:hypothetical protein